MSYLSDYLVELQRTINARFAEVTSVLKKVAQVDARKRDRLRGCADRRVANVSNNGGAAV
jgi:hypothetical protein